MSAEVTGSEFYGALYSVYVTNGRTKCPCKILRLEIRDELPKTMIGKLSRKALLDEEAGKRAAAGVGGSPAGGNPADGGAA